MSAVDQKIVYEALAKRKSFILENLESMTLKTLRKHLEEDLGLEADALRPFKKMIGEYVDTLMAPPAAEKSEDEDEAASDSGSDFGKEGKNSSKKRKNSSPKIAAASKARTYSKTVDRMRSLCRQATITIPPNIYVKNKSDQELEAAFKALLEKNGLEANAGANEVAKVKAQLQIQRDLDGIDTSNIISDGRRSRRGGATNYKEMLKVASDSEEEEEEQEEESDVEGSDSGSESEKGKESPEKKKKTDSPVSTKKESPKIENSVQQPQKATPKALAAMPQSASKEGKTLADIGNQKTLRLADWSDDE